MQHSAVIVGVGEWADRPVQLADAMSPLELMAAALRRAESDAGANLLERVESLDLVGFVSWRHRDPAAELAQMLGIAPARTCNASMGGETPVRLIHEAALAIQGGQISAAAIVGAEAMSSRRHASHDRATLPWPTMVPASEAVCFPGSSYQTGRPARMLDMLDPAKIYPFYEVATQSAWGQTPAEAHAASAKLFARYASVARRNPFAWLRNAPDESAIGDITADNRLIAWPYPKLMVANPNVNLGAAIIVTSLALARESGVPEDRIVHIHGGAAANEPEDYLARDSFAQSTAQQAVLDAAVEIAGAADRFDWMELYSCFPVVPKMALRTLGLEKSGVVPTVTGGLTYFGGPLNNYMSHATAAMVHQLRAHPGDLGLLYGQGGYVSKHHALVLSTTPPQSALPADYSVQPVADALRGAVPELVEDYSGLVSVETYTVTYARDGAPLQGVVIARNAANERMMARVRDDDTDTLARLTDFSSNAVGEPGHVRMDVFGKLVFTFGELPAARARTNTFVEREGPLTIVTIDRPDSMNSLDPRTNEELAEIFDEFAADPNQWVAIITGAGDKAFSAGNDLKETARLMKRGARIETPVTGFGGLTARFDLDKPVIAAVNGVAMGGGFEVALACDIVVASTAATFALPEPRVGLAAVAGGLLRLPQQIGMKQAMGIILTGRKVGAEEGARLGFINEVTAPDELMPAARRWAAAILEASPLAIRAAKQIVARGAAEASLAAGYAAQNRYPALLDLYRSSDMREGPAAFAQKRKPVWKGR